MVDNVLSYRKQSMRVIRGLRNLPPARTGCVLTIGNYDGIHRGHQAVLAELRERAQTLGLQSVVMTFEPTPLEFFQPDEAPPRLASLRESIQDIGACGVDQLLCVRFNQAFADLSPQAFVSDLLVGRLAVQEVLVGADFRYGHRREGDVEMLRRQGEIAGFRVAPLPTVEHAGARVSSTRVREALAAGDPGRASELLGRPYRISGRVITGAQLGRTLDVPTANLELRRKPAPRYGVYAVHAVLEDGRRLPGAASLGVRPTVDGKGCLLEVHILDFDEDIYGCRMDVHFMHYLREEKRFDDTDALRTQMLVDIEQARALLTD